MDADCGPPTRSSGVPRWTLNGRAALWGMVVWLPLLLVEPVVHATEPDAKVTAGPALVVIAAAFVGLAVRLHRRLTHGGASRRPELVLLAVQTVATVVLVLGSPESSLVFPPLAIAAVVALEEPWGLISVPAVTLLSAVVVVAAGGSSGQTVGTAVATVLSGFGCWSFQRLFVVIGELARTRESLARLAVAQERERFSRDLHDLLGHTLSVIVVKAQAVRRLAPTDADAVAEHAADIETIGRRALTEVRQAVDGYRGAGLTAELDRARAALMAAGIACTTTELVPTWPADVDALFGWVVREGVTNVIRHSGARHCAVTWSQDDEQARLEITDDGPHTPAPLSPGGGLAGLTDRVAAGGGWLEVGRTGTGFRLSATVPESSDVTAGA